MYTQFFGLQHEPFSIAPDPRYLFMSERHREALAHLLYGVDGGGGFGQNNVLIIGEAQNLSAEVLEQLRLLTNLETGERKLLQIILIGQPELREMLARPELEQLAQRVIARFHLQALSADETAQYIRHRLSVRGTGGAQ